MMPHNDSLKDQLKQVPTNLADARHHAGLSCAALAKACEVTERTIRNYECGRARFEALVVLLRISKATGVSLDALVGKRR
jgi:transcriptional regulator with XRE-family HTH domain